MNSFLRKLANPNLWVMMLADAVGIAAALVLSYTVRFDFFQSPDYGEMYGRQLIRSLPVVVPLKLFFFVLFGLYRGMWRYTNLRDMRKIAGATGSASLLMVSFIAYRYHFLGFSRSVYLLDAVFTFVFAAGVRIAVREFFSLRAQGRIINPFSWVHDEQAVRPTRTIVLGAGHCGEHLLRELTVLQKSPYEVVCYLDDDPKKQGRSLHGARVYGGLERLPAAIARFQAELILIAIARIDGAGMRRIVEACEKTGLPFKRVPSVGSILDGQVSLKELRDVDFEDLLGRPPVVLDDSAVAQYLRDRVILVTGAGGSIGSELVRQMVRFHPSQIVLVDCGEENLFTIQMELTGEIGFDRIVPVIARVQDERVMRRLFERYRPQTVFHAAAYKHVPLMELNPWEAVETNVLGSLTVMRCAQEAGVERFVLVSTDKAVRPTNVMGATKRLTELILHALAQQGKTVFQAVRFGNVLGSSGSVVPLFRHQIERGGPVTVTHPEVTRYFMTIPEASRLILQAGALGRGGEIFILQMGTAVNIASMARDLIRLSGKEPDTEIKIEFTGLRPGEKLVEELITEGEGIVPTQHEKIMVLRPDRPLDCDTLWRTIDELRTLVARHDAPALKEKLRDAVPEYCPANTPSV